MTARRECSDRCAESRGVDPHHGVGSNPFLAASCRFCGAALVGDAPAPRVTPAAPAAPRELTPWLCRGCGHMHDYGDLHLRERREVFVTVTDYDDEPPPPPLKGAGVVVTQHLAYSCALHADADVAAEVLRMHKQYLATASLPAFYPSRSRAEVAP